MSGGSRAAVAHRPAPVAAVPCVTSAACERRGAVSIRRRLRDTGQLTYQWSTDIVGQPHPHRSRTVARARPQSESASQVY
jgi:hypothetical protein